MIATGISLLNNLYVLNIEATGGQQSSLSTSKSQAITLLSKVTSQPIHVWHQRLGHIHFDRIKQMESSGAVDGLSISTSDKSKFCEGCVFGKHHRQPFPTDGRNRAKRIGEIIHSDLVGPMSVNSPGGARYFALFKDDFSGFCSVSFLKHKSEAANSFQAFVHRVEVETGNRINTLRTDNGGEYVGSSFEEWLKTKGIRHETTVPKTPQQNGVSERQNRTVIESARSMLHFANKPTELWAEATNCAVYVLNRVAAKGLDGKTPYEIWKGRKPNLSHLRIFGCTAYAHIPHDERAKFDPKAIKCCFVGYCETQKAFRLWDPIKRKLRISRDVVFHEEFVTKSLFDIFPDYDPPQSPVEKPDPSEDRDISRSSDEESHNNVPDNFESIQPSIPTSSIKHISSREASTRKKKPPVRWADESTTATYAGMASAYVCDEPETYEEALASDESSSWMEAMKEKIDSLAKNNTWTLVPLPQGRVAIKNRWVFKLKYADGKPVRFKARLVAKGFSQRPGIDYDETYSPVVKHDSLRTVLAIAAAEDLEIVQLDVKTAFLNGDLSEVLYMEQPTGFRTSDNVCLLHRSLYGLKQASRAWNSKFNSFLIKYGFIRSSADPCFYFQQDKEHITILAIWVDDGLLCSSRSTKLQDIVGYLSQNFEMTSGSADCFVGIQIKRNRKERTIHLSQGPYIKKILDKFCLTDCLQRTIPADPFTHLRRNTTTSESQEMEFPFREAVGSLMFAAICTRPDISFAVGQVAQFCNNPSRVHWEATKRILAYLKGTMDHGIVYRQVSSEENVLVAFSDADFAGNIDDRRSTTGNIFIINGGPVAWCSQRQKCVSLSTTEAEYVAASTATKEIIWLRRLLKDLGRPQHNATPLLCDNQSAIKLVRNPEYHQRTKHIDVRYHFIRSMQEDNTLNVKYVQTSEQLADGLTKSLDGPKFLKFKCGIGMFPFV